MQLLVFFILFLHASIFSETKLLIKIATRERPQKFFDCLNSYYNNLSGECSVKFLVSCDLDDLSMNNTTVINQMKKMPNLFFYFSPRDTKIGAINRDIEKHLDFDILLCASDDMFVVKQGFDKIISDTMIATFPDFSGVLSFSDGHQPPSYLNTYPILGKKFYEKYGWIYYPGYKSLFCDLELAILSKILKKEKSLTDVIIEHQHPVWGYEENALYRYNDRVDLVSTDKLLFLKRKANNFGLKNEEILTQTLPTSLDIYIDITSNVNVKWSILICTLEERSAIFSNLYVKLIKQIERNHLEKEIEVIFFKDNRESSVGYKRNKLMESSRGEYISFIDDDDISDDYIPMIFNALKRNPDCVSLKGLLLEPDKKPHLFYNSNRFKFYFIKNQTYYRPPTHLNTIKAEIAKQFKFPEKNRFEDFDWSMEIANSRFVKKRSYN